jgi:hypothetical protein
LPPRTASPRVDTRPAPSPKCSLTFTKHHIHLDFARLICPLYKGWCAHARARGTFRLHSAAKTLHRLGYPLVVTIAHPRRTQAGASGPSTITSMVGMGAAFPPLAHLRQRGRDGDGGSGGGGCVFVVYQYPYTLVASSLFSLACPLVPRLFAHSAFQCTPIHTRHSPPPFTVSSLAVHSSTDCSLVLYQALRGGDSGGGGGGDGT